MPAAPAGPRAAERTAGGAATVADPGARVWRPARDGPGRPVVRTSGEGAPRVLLPAQAVVRRTMAGAGSAAVPVVATPAQPVGTREGGARAAGGVRRPPATDGRTVDPGARHPVRRSGIPATTAGKTAGVRSVATRPATAPRIEDVRGTPAMAGGPRTGSVTEGTSDAAGPTERGAVRRIGTRRGTTSVPRVRVDPSRDSRDATTIGATGEAAPDRDSSGVTMSGVRAQAGPDRGSSGATMSGALGAMTSEATTETGPARSGVRMSDRTVPGVGTATRSGARSIARVRERATARAVPGIARTATTRDRGVARGARVRGAHRVTGVPRRIGIVAGQRQPGVRRTTGARPRIETVGGRTSSVRRVSGGARTTGSRCRRGWSPAPMSRRPRPTSTSSCCRAASGPSCGA